MELYVIFFDHTMYPGIGIGIGIGWLKISGNSIGIGWNQSSGIGIGWNFGIGTSLLYSTLFEWPHLIFFFNS